MSNAEPNQSSSEIAPVGPIEYATKPRRPIDRCYDYFSSKSVESGRAR